MKRIGKVLIISLLFFSILNLLGCSRIIGDEGHAYEELSTGELYVKKIFAESNIFNSRSVNVQEYPDFFYDLSIEDVSGNKLFFDDFSIQEKDCFVEVWKSIIVKEIDDNDDEELKNTIRLESIAFLDAVNSCGSSRKSIEDRYNNIFKKYSELLNDRKSFDERNSRARPYISNDCVVDKSYRIYKNNYKRGRILITTDTGSSSGSSFVGHAALMDAKRFPDNIKGNALVPGSISSYPQTIASVWDGQQNGVQFEPFGLWVGNDAGSIDHVYIYNVQKVVWVWDWFKSHYKYIPASDSDYNKAADNAESKIGIGYGIVSKESTNLMYCSALVWQSWRYIDKGYDMSLGFQVLPSEIANSKQTTKLIEFYNK